MTPKLTIKTILEKVKLYLATNYYYSSYSGEDEKKLFEDFLTLSLNQLLDEIKIEKREGKQGEDCDCIMGDNGEFYEGCGCKINTWNSAIDELEKLKNKLR